MSTTSSPGDNLAHILVVDDHPAICETLTKIIDNQMDMRALDPARTAREALDTLEQKRVDVMVVDFSLPDIDGLEFIIQVQKQDPDIHALVYSRHNERIYAERALQAGAQGYLMKTTEPQEVLTAIRAIRRGQIYLSEEMRARTLNNLVTESASNSGLSALTEREQAVFEAIGRGLSMEEVAEELGITQKTAEHYRRQAKEKLELESTGQLLHHAIAWIHSRPNTP
jgi:DNA-binding NarL/FixJ family response regulator